MCIEVSYFMSSPSPLSLSHTLFLSFLIFIFDSPYTVARQWWITKTLFASEIEPTLWRSIFLDRHLSAFVCFLFCSSKLKSHFPSSSSSSSSLLLQLMMITKQNKSLLFISRRTRTLAGMHSSSTWTFSFQARAKIDYCLTVETLVTYFPSKKSTRYAERFVNKNHLLLCYFICGIMCVWSTCIPLYIIWTK